MFVDRTFPSTEALRSSTDDAQPCEVFEPATLLAVLETSLNETIGHFAEVSGKISERVLQHGLMSDFELIVGLQALDRLQQELTAYTGIVHHCANALSDPAETERLADPIDAITLADLKKRLYDRCRNDVAMLSSAPGSVSF